MEDRMRDWRWFVAVWAIAAALLAVGLIAANWAIPDAGFQRLTIGR
jgi:hypothetical protein